MQITVKRRDGVLGEISGDIHSPSEMKIFHESFLKIFDEAVTDNIALCKGSEEVAVKISGYIAKILRGLSENSLETGYQNDCKHLL